MSYHLFLDDIRDPSWVHWLRLPAKPDREWVIVRNFEEFVAAIEQRGMPDFVSFDHDLDQEGQISYERTGMDCAHWLVDRCLDQDMDLPAFDVHSYNSVGRDNIRGLLEGYSRFRAGDANDRIRAAPSP